MTSEDYARLEREREESIERARRSNRDRLAAQRDEARRRHEEAERRATEREEAGRRGELGVKIITADRETYWQADLADLDRDEVAGLLDGASIRNGHAPLGGLALSRMRARLLGEGVRPRRVTRPTMSPGDPLRCLVPGLWRKGTQHLIAGQSKVGKTMLVGDLAATLTVPGRRFLGRFGPVPDEYLADIAVRNVWVINAETPPDDFNTVLWDAGVNDEEPWPEPLVRDLMPGRDAPFTPLDALNVVHLEQEDGGAGSFDLTVRENYERWARDLAGCLACDGRDDWTPAVVLVDGLKAILEAADKDPERDVGRWFARFRRLLRELDVPDGAITFHTTKDGLNMLGAGRSESGPDGLWFFVRGGSKPDAPRRFWSHARAGGIPVSPVRVVREDGRLRALEETRRRPEGDVAADSGHVAPGGDDSTDGGRAPGQAADGRTARPRMANAGPGTSAVRAAVLGYVADCNAAGSGPSVRAILDGVSVDLPGGRRRSDALDAARKALLAEGMIKTTKRQGRGGGLAHWITEAGRAAAGAAEPTTDG